MKNDGWKKKMGIEQIIHGVLMALYNIVLVGCASAPETEMEKEFFEKRVNRKALCEEIMYEMHASPPVGAKLHPLTGQT